TFIGKMEKVPYKEVEAVKKAYLAKHPGQEYLLDFVDFTFYRMKIEKIFYIGGFGDINWIDVDDYLEHWEK
ncbi:MAG: pyridoxamine 5'-phosphate oxidase, partial [Candidatus Dadabacteria bacterium]|nr:pyridoxamine 5'-phosphate oxidase [Candidatus Dadabacteria bacterium]